MSEFRRVLLQLLCLFLLNSHLSLAADVPTAEEAYLEKFNTYLYWTQHLPLSADPAFLSFIEETSPLTIKLREKWLYHLAQTKHWALYHEYYRSSNDHSLVCYEQLAVYELGQQSLAVEHALPLWMNEQTPSLACTTLFTVLLDHHEFSADQMEHRIALALEHNETSLALSLLTRAGREEDKKSLLQIAKDSNRIVFLHPGALSGDLYLYGLKQLVARNNKAVYRLWTHAKAKELMNEDQTQQFLAYLALYKAMRNQEDAPIWFRRVKADYYDASLRDWELRYALAHQQWQTVIQLTEGADHQQELSWQYWRARALERMGQLEEAHRLYQNLALQRTYYGFLASMRLQQVPQFQDDPATQDVTTLNPYKSIIDRVLDQYRNRRTGDASRLLNDFSSELSKTEKSSLNYWIAETLHWPGKAVYMSTNDEVLYHQLSLRFPLAHQTSIQRSSAHYHIEQALIYAMIRQESTFFEDIQSSAGAYGLMQVLPRTAKIVAKQDKIPYRNPQELFTPDKNIQIGVAYLNMLSRQFGSHPILMAAAYNAGPKQVRYWLKNRPHQDIDIWVETLPWQETRNYLKNVIAFYQVYQYRLHQKSDLSHFLQIS